MGGLPCYQKVLADGALQKAANNLIAESKITTDLLAAKGYYDSPMLQEFIKFETECKEYIKEKEQMLHKMNMIFANEIDLN